MKWHRLPHIPLLAVALSQLLTTGCSPADLVGEGELPPGAADPKETHNRAGALRAYRAGAIAFRYAVGGEIGSYILASGTMTDELRAMDDFFGPNRILDRRVLTEYSDPDAENRVTFGYGAYARPYDLLQIARARARVGADLLRRFAPEESPALAAHLQALEGYADIYLADFFCSGIPLSTVDAEGYTLAPGSSTAEVYRRAIGLLDSALADGGDSVRVVHLAAIGKGRALLALGQYAAAAAAVAAVPDGFEYFLEFDATNTGQSGEVTRAAANFMYQLNLFGSSAGPGMSNGEGANGLDWISSGDPRSEATSYSNDYAGNPRYMPARLSPEGDTPIPVADWREARLIEAEAALQANDVAGWLAKLNLLRQTGIAPALPDLVDPGTPEARVDLLFRERGLWLHLTGRRQGDLRRLIREYGRDPSTVYPIGAYLFGGSYGADVTAPIPAKERRYNRFFTGCQNRGA